MAWPVLLPQQTGVFTDTITLESKTVTHDPDYNEEIESWGTEMVDVACRITVPSLEQAMASTERRYADRTEIKEQYLVAIPQYLPEITTAWRVLIDDVPWGIRGVQANRLVTVTRLLLERVSL
jgi:head-tail adaptor